MKKMTIALGVMLTATLGFGQCPGGSSTNQYFNTCTNEGDGFRLFNSNNYKIHLGNTSTKYHYGPVSNWAMKFNMYSQSGRGWVWGPNNAKPVAALNKDGDMQVKGNFVAELGKVGVGITNPVAKLDVMGNIRSKTGGGTDWLVMETDNGNGFFRIHNRAAQDQMLFGWDDGTSQNFNFPFTIHKNGYVGVGTSDPVHKMAVQGSEAPVTGLGNCKESVIRINNINATDGSNSEIQFGVTSDNDKTLATIATKHTGLNGSYHGAALIFGTTDTDSDEVIERMRITQNGRIGIGTTAMNGSLLAVAGKLSAEEIEVSLSSGWSDFVFDDDYKLASLSEVEKFINENHHLPDVPSAKEVEKSGINLGKMDAILLQKIEELTLHMIALEKENAVLKSLIESK